MPAKTTTQPVSKLPRRLPPAKRAGPNCEHDLKFTRDGETWLLVIGSGNPFPATDIEVTMHLEAERLRAEIKRLMGLH